MERVAAEAGVSRALPYKHFDNLDALLVALYRRETSALGQAVWRALQGAPAGDAVALAVGAYFDALGERRDVLVALSSPGAAIPAMADPDRAGDRFVAEVLHRFVGVDRRRATAVAGMVQGAIVGAASTWLAGQATRRRLEARLVTVIRSALA